MRAPLSGCLPVLLAQGHQAGHLLLGHADLLAAELGQRHVFDFERGEFLTSFHDDLQYGLCSRSRRLPANGELKRWVMRNRKWMGGERRELRVDEPVL